MDWFTALEGVDELETAEDFLDFFEIEYDPEQVRINRLHIMHRFNQKLTQASTERCVSANDRYLLAQSLLGECYATFHKQEARLHSSMNVYKRLEPSFVPLSQLQGVRL